MTVSFSVSVALIGSGGAGSMTAGKILLDAASKAGFYGVMAKSMGPQIRGGEAAAFVRISTEPVTSPDDRFDVLIAWDWLNVERFAAELPLGSDSVIIADPDQGAVPGVMATYGARIGWLPLKSLAASVEGGRANMVGLGAVAALIGLPIDTLKSVVAHELGRKGPEVVGASSASIEAGAKAAENLPPVIRLPAHTPDGKPRWNISGNEAAGLGALRGGVKFVAAYPITPATEVLELMATGLGETGGTLVQAEDELASINMVIGSSFAGAPSMTATSGPGLALMTESIGLAAASEIPVVVLDVMRCGPSTGIPTKSEQADLDIAIHGLHGDAAHLVLAPNSIGDCLFTTQWAVHLADALQTPTIVLSDQAMGQARAIIGEPGDIPFVAEREVAQASDGAYRRYAVTNSGVSPIAVPGTRGTTYVADGLEHNERGTPSAQASDHQIQLDKRARKLDVFDYGDHWADIEGEGEVAVITWGSLTGAAREALERARQNGQSSRLISLRLLLPAQPERMARALEGVTKALVVEQTHGQQFYKYLRGNYDLPKTVSVLNRAGPLPILPAEIENRLAAWSLSQ